VSVFFGYSSASGNPNSAALLPSFENLENAISTTLLKIIQKIHPGSFLSTYLFPQAKTSQEAFLIILSRPEFRQLSEHCDLAVEHAVFPSDNR